MATDASLVIYTGIPLSYIDVDPNDNLQTALVNINTAVNDMNPAPDYSGYNLYCITQTDGITHPTNTQNFAEGISKIVCDNKDEYDNFVDTTYADQVTTFSTAISALQTPALTYSTSGGGISISITSGMTRNQVLTAIYTPLGSVLGVLNAPGSTWSTLSISQPTTLTAAFNSLIAYIDGMDTAIAGKQDELPTIDNSGNCLAGTSTDTVIETIDLLTSYACALPEFVAGDITWGGVSTGTDLQEAVQNTINSVNYLLQNGVVDAGDGLTESSVGSTYQGKKLSMDETYSQYYKVMADEDDDTPDFLFNKLESSDNSVTITAPGAPGDPVDITVTTPMDNKVKVNSSDSTAGYLATKIPSTSDGTWGLYLLSAASGDNSTLQLTPSIGNPYLLSSNLMNYWLTDSTLLELFGSLVSASSSTPGTAVSTLVVSLDGTDFDLQWTPTSGSSQLAKWRQSNSASWVLTGFTTPNPLTDTENNNTLPSPIVNTVIQFQIDTVFSGGTVSGNIAECIEYDCQTLGYTVVSQTVNVYQSPLATVETVEYRIKNSGGTVVDNQTATGPNPVATFTALSADTYSVEWRYATTVNGATLYSTDASQLNAWCSQGSIVVS